MPKIELDVPEGYEDIGELLKKYVEEITAAAPDTRGGRAVDFAKFERAAGRSAATLERETLRRLLQSLDIDAERVCIGGKEHARVGRYEATYSTQAGPVVVERSIYRKVGERNGKAVDPVSVRAGVLEGGWLPSAAQAMAYLMQQGTSREAEATARQLGRLPYSRSSFERVGQAVGGLFEASRLDVEEVLAESEPLAAEVRAVSASLDRVAVPMEEVRKRPRGRPRKGAPARPVARVFRMAYCATVTEHDGEGNALRTVRYGRMPKGSADELCESLAGDVAALLRKKPGLRVVQLTDGAPELAFLLARHLNEETVGVEPVRLVDFWHVAEKLGRAAVALDAENSASMLARWKMQLANHSGAAASICAELSGTGGRDLRCGDSRPVHEAITYLENHGDRMDYAWARANGLPVGSGNVEATCKSLVAVRMKRPGSRWKEATGERILHLRALALSDRWDAALKLTLAPLRKAIRLVA